MILFPSSVLFATLPNLPDTNVNALLLLQGKSMGFISEYRDVVGEVDKLIRSTQNPKGLAIAIGLVLDEDHLSEKITTNTEILTDTFSELGYAAKRFSVVVNDTKIDIVTAVTYHTELSDHPIVFAISGQVAGGDPNHLLHKRSHSYIDINNAILEPLCIPYLSQHPKIFLIMAYTGTETLLDLSHLMVPSEGNFILAYIHSKTIHDISSETTEILQHALQNTKASIDEVLDEVRRNIPGHSSMKVISRLDKPVYIHDDPVDLHRSIGEQIDPTGTGKYTI